MAAFRQFMIVNKTSYRNGKCSGDFRPANILLSVRGNSIIIDFSSGAGKLKTSRDPKARYRLPEYILNKEFVIDVRGIGATIFYVLTGKYLDDIADDKGLWEEIEKIKKVGPKAIGLKLADIIKKFLNPHDYYDSLYGVDVELEDFFTILIHETGREDMNWGEIVSKSVSNIALTSLDIYELLMFKEHGDQTETIEDFVNPIIEGGYVEEAPQLDFEEAS